MRRDRQRGSIAIESILSVSVLMVLIVTLFGTLLTIYCDEKMEWAALQAQAEMSVYSMPFMGDDHFIKEVVNELALTTLANKSLKKHMDESLTMLVRLDTTSKVQLSEYGVAEYDIRYDYKLPSAFKSNQLIIPIGAALISDGIDFSDDLVFITQYGEKYHLDGCRHLRKSKFGISLVEAKNKGYEACKTCHKAIPPVD